MPTFVQCQTVQNGGTTSLSKAITTTAGNSVVVVLVFDVPKASVGTITQTAGDTTSVIAPENNDATTNWYIHERVVRNVAGGATTFTFTFSLGAACMFLVETTPLNATPVDVFVVGGGNTGTTHAVGPTAAIADANEFALAAWVADGSSSNTPSVDNGFTIPTGGDVMGAGVTDCRAALAYKDITSAPTVTLTTNVGVSTTAAGLLTTFRLPAAAFTIIGRTVLDYGGD